MRLNQWFVLLVLLMPLTATAQLSGVDYEWTEKKNSDAIQIYTSPVAGSAFKAVRGEMVVKASVSSLVALVDDLPVCADWADLCRESRLEKRISAIETYVYVYNDIPFPVSDRDVYAHVVWSKDAASGRVTMTSKATAGGTPETKAVRISNAVSQWHFTPINETSTKVESFAHIDPNGPTPAWLTNLMLVSSPFKTMTRMREIVESGQYAETLVPLLDEL